MSFDKNSIAALKKRWQGTNAATNQSRSKPRSDQAPSKRRRRSARTVQLNVRVAPAFKERLQGVADEAGVPIVTVLEDAVTLYELNRKPYEIR